MKLFFFLSKRLFLFLFFFLVFSQKTLAIDSITDRLYTGQIKDDTGLYYYNARYYDPQLGIFTSADRAQGPNRYAYVGGNPIMKNDPTGNEGGSPLDQWRGKYRSPLRQFDPSGINFVPSLLVPSAPFVSMMPFFAPPFGVLASASIQLADKRIDLNVLRSGEYQSFEERIWSATDFDANKKGFVRSLTVSVHRNVVYNPNVLAAVENSSPSLFSTKGLIKDQMNPNILSSMINNTGTCQHIASYLNYLLGAQGINSQIIAAKVQVGLQGGFHAYSRVNIDGVVYVADPTFGYFMPEKDYDEIMGVFPLSLKASPEDIDKGRLGATFYRIPEEFQQARMFSGIYKTIFGESPSAAEDRMADMYVKRMRDVTVGESD